MKKCWICLVCLICVLWVAAVGHAEILSGQCGDNAFFSLDENGVMTLSGQGKMWDFSGSNEQPCPWTGDKDQIREVTMQDGITYIGADSFSRCTELRKVTFSDSVTHIGNFAFSLCEQLGNFTLPSGLERIGQQAFWRTAITEIVFPGTVYYLQSCICEDCSNLTKVLFKQGANTGFYVSSNMPFRNCKSLKRIEVEEGHGILSSEDGVLYCSDTLWQYPCGKEDVSFHVRKGCKRIFDGAFENADSLQYLYLPRKMETIDKSAFYWCDNLTYIKMPDTIKTIGSAAFWGCDRFSEIDYAGSEADWQNIDINEQGNQALLSATIHYNVTEGYEPAISTGKCGNNVDYSFDNGTLTLSGSGPMWDFRNDSEAFDYHPCPWEEEKDRIRHVVIENGISRIGASAFHDCDQLLDISIPGSVKDINAFAFVNCDAVTSIVIPYWMKEIDQGVFAYCDNLSYVKLPLNLLTIDYEAFRDCNNLSRIDYEGGEEDWKKIQIYKYNDVLNTAKINYHVPYENESTTTPAPVVPTGPYTDPGGTGIYSFGSDGMAIYSKPVSSAATVSIPATIAVNGQELRVVAIANNAFKGDKKLTTVIIGKNIKTIGKNAFASCPKLKIVKGGAAVTTIKDGSFSGCKVLKAFPAMGKLQKIGANAFKGDKALPKFTLAKSVTSIGKNAFNGCAGLKTITVKAEKLTTKNVGAGAFKGIDKKATFSCPKKQLKAYRKLFVKKGAPKTCKFK